MHLFIISICFLLEAASFASASPTFSLDKIRSPLIEEFHGPNNGSESRSLSKRAVTNIPIGQGSNLIYVQGFFGTNNVPETLLVDTGSAVLSIGRTQASNQAATSGMIDGVAAIPGPIQLRLSYGGGEVAQAVEYKGDFGFGLRSVVQDFAVYNTFLPNPTPNFDGILGLGLTALTRGVIQSNLGATIPTVLDNFCNDASSPKQFAIALRPNIGTKPATFPGTLGLELTLCGYDDSIYGAGPNPTFTQVPTIKQIAAQTTTDFYFWALSVQITLGNGGPAFQGRVGVLDSGSDGIYLNADDFTIYTSLFGAGNWQEDNGSGWLMITQAASSNIPTLNLQVKSAADGTNLQYNLIADAQLLPIAQAMTLPGYDPNFVYLRIKQFPVRTQGYIYDFLIGTPFLERFYVVHDASQAAPQISISTTGCTNVAVNNGCLSPPAGPSGPAAGPASPPSPPGVPPGQPAPIAPNVHTCCGTCCIL